MITLGVIGVVAAITLPTLIYSYNKHITETRLKKFYSLFNQAIRLSVADNEEVEGWDDYWDTSKNSYDENGQLLDKYEKIDAAFNKYLAPYMKIMLTKHVYDEQNHRTISLYFLADGSAFSYRGIDSRDIVFYPKNPEKCMKQPKNKGRCAFDFIFYPLGNQTYWKYHYKKGLETYMFNWNGQKEMLINDSLYGCNETGGGSYCSTLIKENGWKIPSNYPLKIQY